MNIGRNHPLISIINRWIRWVLFSSVAAVLVSQLDWSNKPEWLLFCVFFGGWFLIESIYSWLSIRMLNYSNFPIFLTFRECSYSNWWPNQKKYIHLKRQLDHAGFTKLQTLQSPITETVSIFSVVFENEEKNIGLQVFFIPISSSSISHFYIFQSKTVEGKLLITDNLKIPFGGYYPEDWLLQRKPLISTWNKLLNLHENIIRREGHKCMEWTETPLENINREQQELRRINFFAGFLIPPHLQDTYGRISAEGRYRIWKEMWLLKYTGRCLSL